MMSMREHVYRLHGLHLIFYIEQLQVTCLCGRITTYIYNALGFSEQDYIHYILVHTCTWGVSDDDIRTAIFVAV